MKAVRPPLSNLAAMMRPSHRPFTRPIQLIRPFESRIAPAIFQSASTRTVFTNSIPSQNLLARSEQAANNNPKSISAQTAFYTALLRANMPEILVERYETGRYATNSSCDAMYQRALERMGTHQMQGNPEGIGALQGQQQQQHQQGLSSQQLMNVARGVVANARGGTQGKYKNPAGETGEKSSPIHVIVNESFAMTVWKVVKFLLTWGLAGYFLLVLITFGVEASGLLRRVGGPSNTEVKPSQQKTKFDDVKGCDEAKEELKEIVDFLRSPDKYNQLGGKLPKGVLMVGPPGTGKTLLARAVAGEAGVPFFYMSGSEFDEVYVGVGAKRVRELFQNAKAKAPAIVFIDELDAVGGKRNERDASYHMQTLNQMLTELDGFDQTTGVVFIAATNFPQMLDKALTRPGRFDRQVVVNLPDVRGRIEILNYYMRNMSMATDVDSSFIARGTIGFSGADLENLVNQAAVHASKIGGQKVTMLDLEWAKDRVLMGAEKKSMIIPEAEKLMTAYHEAGHALVALYTEGAMPLYKCTILPRGQALGVTFSLPEMDKHSESKRELYAHIDRAMGGKVAEELIYGEDNVTSGCSSDLSMATNVAYAMVTQYGMSALGPIAFKDLYNSLSAQTKQQIEDQVRKILEDGTERARVLLVEKKNELDLLAKALIKYETLSREEIEKVVKGEALDRPESIPQMPIKIPQLQTS